MKGKIFVAPIPPTSNSQLVGQGQKSVLVVVSAAETSEKTLKDLLKAIKHDPASDVFTLTIDQTQPVDLSSILAKYSIQKVISFGFRPSELGFHINEAYYHAYTIGELCLIFSESIDVLNTDKAKKVALWQTLQSVFLK